MENERETFVMSELAQEYDNFRKHDSFPKESLPSFVQILSLFRVTTKIPDIMELLPSEFGHHIVMSLVKWLILKNIIVQQHTVSFNCSKFLKKPVYF